MGVADLEEPLQWRRRSKHSAHAAHPLPAAPDGGFTAHGYSQEIRMLIGSGLKGQGGTALVYKSTSLLSGVLIPRANDFISLVSQEHVLLF